MTLDETLAQLEAPGSEKISAHNARYGAGSNRFGVKHGDIRRAVAVGEKLGIYRDYPVSTGLHIALRPDLDWRNGQPERVNETRQVGA
jgi:hypothetical protein